jgi:hypothetical protein
MNTATLEEIAGAILRLTYGDMIALAQSMCDLIDGEPVDSDRMASIIHQWAEDAAPEDAAKP